MICTRCKKEKEEIEFTFRSKAKGLRRNICRACQHLYQREWYAKNSDTHKKNVYKERDLRRQKRREFIQSFKNEPCMDCNKRYHPFVMDFDHRDSESKIEMISIMALRLWPMDKIKEEIEKCDVICSNCHRIRTGKRIGVIK